MTREELWPEKSPNWPGLFKLCLKRLEGADISHISGAEIISLHINMIHKLLPFMTFERENFCLERTENFCETYGTIYTKDILLSDDAQVNVEHFVVRHPDRALKVLKYGKQENIPVGCILPIFPVPGVGDWVDLPPSGCRLPPPPPLDWDPWSCDLWCMLGSHPSLPG